MRTLRFPNHAQRHMRDRSLGRGRHAASCRPDLGEARAYLLTYLIELSPGRHLIPIGINLEAVPEGGRRLKLSTGAGAVRQGGAGRASSGPQPVDFSRGKATQGRITAEPWRWMRLSPATPQGRLIGRLCLPAHSFEASSVSKIPSTDTDGATIPSPTRRYRCLIDEADPRDAEASRSR